MFYCKIQYREKTKRHVISRNTVNRGPVNRGYNCTNLTEILCHDFVKFSKIFVTNIQNPHVLNSFLLHGIKRNTLFSHIKYGRSLLINQNMWHDQLIK